MVSLFSFTLQTIHKSRASTAQNLLTSHPRLHRGQATLLPTLTYCRASRPALRTSNHPHTEAAALCGPPSTSLRPTPHPHPGFRGVGPQGGTSGLFAAYSHSAWHILNECTQTKHINFYFTFQTLPSWRFFHIAVCSIYLALWNCYKIFHAVGWP